MQVLSLESAGKNHILQLGYVQVLLPVLLLVKLALNAYRAVAFVRSALKAHCEHLLGRPSFI